MMNLGIAVYHDIDCTNDCQEHVTSKVCGSFPSRLLTRAEAIVAWLGYRRCCETRSKQHPRLHLAPRIHLHLNGLARYSNVRT